MTEAEVCAIALGVDAELNHAGDFGTATAVAGVDAVGAEVGVEEGVLPVAGGGAGGVDGHFVGGSDGEEGGDNAGEIVETHVGNYVMCVLLVMEFGEITNTRQIGIGENVRGELAYSGAEIQVDCWNIECD